MARMFTLISLFAIALTGWLPSISIADVVTSTPASNRPMFTVTAGDTTSKFIDTSTPLDVRQTGGVGATTVMTESGAPLHIRPDPSSTFSMDIRTVSGAAIMPVAPVATSTWFVVNTHANSLAVKPDPSSTTAVDLNSVSTSALMPVAPAATSTWFVVNTHANSLAVKPDPSSTTAVDIRTNADAVAFDNSAASGNLLPVAVPLGATHYMAIEGVAATSDGVWVDTGIGFGYWTRASVDVSGITTATVQIRGSNAATIPANSADERQIGTDITANGLFVAEPLPRWFKVDISAWTSGTITIGVRLQR